MVSIAVVALMEIVAVVVVGSSCTAMVFACIVHSWSDEFGIASGRTCSVVPVTIVVTADIGFVVG